MSIGAIHGGGSSISAWSHYLDLKTAQSGTASSGNDPSSSENAASQVIGVSVPAPAGVGVNAVAVKGAASPSVSEVQGLPDYPSIDGRSAAHRLAADASAAIARSATVSPAPQAEPHSASGVSAGHPAPVAPSDAAVTASGTTGSQASASPTSQAGSSGGTGADRQHAGNENQMTAFQTFSPWPHPTAAQALAYKAAQLISQSRIITPAPNISIDRMIATTASPG